MLSSRESVSCASAPSAESLRFSGSLRGSAWSDEDALLHSWLRWREQSGAVVPLMLHVACVKVDHACWWRYVLSCLRGVRSRRWYIAFVCTSVVIMMCRSRSCDSMTGRRATTWFALSWMTRWTQSWIAGMTISRIFRKMWIPAFPLCVTLFDLFSIALSLLKQMVDAEPGGGVGGVDRYVLVFCDPSFRDTHRLF